MLNLDARAKAKLTLLNSSAMPNRLTNVKKIIDRRFSGVVSDFANAVEASPSQVSQWLSGYRSIGEKAARKIEAALMLKVGNLDAGDDLATEKEVSLSSNPDYPTIRRARITLSAGATGFGVTYDDANETDDRAPLVFPRAWYERRGLVPTKLLAVRVANGSMEPGLWHGDTVVINTADTDSRDGDVFAVNYEGELVIKRLVRDAGHWWLASDNSDQTRYPRKLCHPGVVLLGRIVHKQSDRI